MDIYFLLRNLSVPSWTPHTYKLPQFSSVTQLCPTLCNPMNCSTPGFPVLHQLPEFTQTQVHLVGDAIQASHPIVLFSSYLQSFPAAESFPIVSSLHQVAKVLELQLQPQSFQWIFRNDFLWDWLVWSTCSPRVFSNTIVQKHQFFGAQLSLWSNSHTHTWLLEKT